MNKQQIKVETIEQFLSRGGRIKKVDFRHAYNKQLSGFYTSRTIYEQNKEEHPKIFQQHKERLETVAIIKKKIASNDI